MEKDGDKKEHLEDDLEEEEKPTPRPLNGMRIEEYASSPKLLRTTTPFSAFNPLSEVPLESSLVEADLPSSESSSDSGGDDENSQKHFKVRKWPTWWYWQFLVLLVRTFRQSRHVILSKLNLIQTVMLTTVACFIWFQLPKYEESISDRYGYVSYEMLQMLPAEFLTITLSILFLAALLHDSFLGISATDHCHYVM